MTPWQQPDGLVGSASLIKVSLGTLGPQQYRCPARDAMAARPELRARTRPHGTRELLDSFAMGPFMSAIDLIEKRRHTMDEALDRTFRTADRPIHDGVQQWTTHAVRGYLHAFADDHKRSMRAVRTSWSYRRSLATPDGRGAEQYQINAWGRCYVSADGRIRELRLITNRLHARSRADAEIAVAALVVARGGPGALPERLRIVQFGMLEGTSEILFEGTGRAADEMYRQHGRDALGAVVDSDEYRPGALCADCPYASVCPALRRTPGLLGLRKGGRPRRSWSPTSGRTYRECPARHYMRQQRLPVDTAVEHGASAERGRAIHAFLQRRHRPGGDGRCAPRVPPDWVPESYTLADRERDLGSVLLRHHAEVCPLRYATEVKPEPDLVYDDTDANVVVLVKPDLLYQDRGAWVWRELKTSASNRRRSVDVFVEYPQLALAVVLIARGLLGPGRGRVELEMLKPGGVDLKTIDPFSGSALDRAERALLELVRTWRIDDRFTATPGDGCRRCEMARWCSAKLGAAA